MPSLTSEHLAEDVEIPVLPSPNLSPIPVPNIQEEPYQNVIDVHDEHIDGESLNECSFYSGVPRYTYFHSFYSKHSVYISPFFHVGYRRKDKKKGENDIINRIRRLAVTMNLSLRGVSQIMDTFRDLFPFLPKDPRTILRTPRHCRMRSIAGGVYVHLGLKAGLLNSLNAAELCETGIKIQVNFDGLQLYSSSSTT